MAQDSTEPRPEAAGNGEPSGPDAELVELAREVRAALESWSARMAGAVSAGRGATTVARMVTARSAAELRRFSLPPAAGGQPESELRAAAAEYLRRVKAAVDRAAHQIERNRYSLHEMHSELERLEPIYRRIVPDAPTTSNQPASESPEAEGPPAANGENSGEPGRRADDGSPDREVGPREERPL